jgi:hypothetical protein
MENKQIKKEIDKEVDDFEKARIERDAKTKGADFNVDQALRYNKGKLKWSLVDWKSLEPMVRVLEMGAEKYAPYNWTKGMPVTEVSESLLRHMFAYLDGENTDPESGIEHLGHVMCNVMFLIHIMREKPEFDNRTIINKKDDNG